MSKVERKNIKIILDFTHMGRKVTGIERVTEQVFSEDNLKDLEYLSVRANGVFSMVLMQYFGMLYYALKYPKAYIITPGFPPSLLITFFFGKRVIPYIHDMFLIERLENLNLKAKFYMRPALKYAVKKCGMFYVNSIKTKQELTPYLQPHSKVILLRPQVNNLFDLSRTPDKYSSEEKVLKIVMLGTIEPRKNYRAALSIFKQVKFLYSNSELHIVGRPGWGGEKEYLENEKNVYVHGYLDDSQLKNLIESSSFFLNTSFDEGLGLPLLEVQYSGVVCVVSNIPVFKEVLKGSAVFIKTEEIELSAKKIVSTFESAEQMNSFSASSVENVKNWNELANKDLKCFLEKFTHKEVT